MTEKLQKTRKKKNEVADTVRIQAGNGKLLKPQDLDKT